MLVSVIIPAYNEKENLKYLLPYLKKDLAKKVSNFEILVIDGGSTDGTQEIAASLGAKVIPQRLPGYGGALKEGFKAAHGEYIITMDADLSHDPDFIAEMLKNRHRADVFIASRYISGGSAKMGIIRKMLSIILNKVFRSILSLPFKDISSGFRMYKRKVFEGLEIIAEDFDILEEILIKLFCLGWEIIEIPFHYQARARGGSHAKLLKLGKSYLKTLLIMWKLRNSLFSADYDERAYNSRIPLQRYWQRRRFEIITGFLDNRDDVLDIGCGSSRIIKSLPQAVALDIDLKKLRYLRKSHKKLVKADISALPFKNASFKTVICSQVIEHVVKDSAIFKEINRVLIDNGTLILGTPDYSRWQWRVIEWFYARILPGAYAQHHISRYSRKELGEILGNANLRVSSYYYTLGAELNLKAKKEKGKNA